jgi:UDP:flavonoid glycosyltransferase YjiC (YdhE family)
VAASVVIHHAGLNTANDALALGRPVIAMPAGLESQLTAWRLKGLGVGLDLPEPVAPADLAAALPRALALGSAAQVVAQDIARPHSLPAVLGAIAALLA